MRKGLNILFTSAHFPFPLIGGDRIKQYYILKHLAKRNNVFVVAFNRKYPVKKEDIEHLSELGIKSYPVDLSISKALLNAGLHSPFGYPLEIEFFRNEHFKNIIRDICKNNRIDLVINYFLRTTEYVKNIECKKYLMAEDCRSFYQGRTYQVSKNLIEKSIRFYEAFKLKKYEREITDFFNLTTLVSEEDRNEMQKLNPLANIKILSNGTDTDKFKPTEIPNRRKDIIFVGKLDVWVNNLMIDRIILKILPRILKVLPETVFHIVGANPQRKHFKIQNRNIILHHDVEDTVPYLQNAAVFIHPHIGGSGIQNKLLEAMACACPVITTTSGARGIDLINGQDGFILENDEDLAGQTIELLTNDNIVHKIGLNAREFILKNHSWEKIYQQLDNLLDDVMNN